MHKLRPVCRNIRPLSRHFCRIRIASISNSFASAKLHDNNLDLLPVCDGVLLRISNNGMLRNYRLAATSNANTLPKTEAGVQAPETKSKSKKFEITRDQLLDLIEAKTLNIYDVREPNEVAETGTITGAINISLTKLKASFSLDPQEFKASFDAEKPGKDDQNVVFYGYSSVKSAAALEIAQKLGFKKSRHYPGGWEEWASFLSKA